MKHRVHATMLVTMIFHLKATLAVIDRLTSVLYQNGVITIIYLILRRRRRNMELSKRVGCYFFRQRGTNFVGIRKYGKER